MKEKTLAIIKPDAVQDKNTGNIIQRIEEEQFSILGMKKILLTKQDAKEFYKVHSERPFYEDLTAYMASGPIVVLCLERENAILHWRNVIGSTDPKDAASNTIRKLYGRSKEENAVHGSDSLENAEIEIQFFSQAFNQNF